MATATDFQFGVHFAYMEYHPQVQNLVTGGKNYVTWLDFKFVDGCEHLSNSESYMLQIYHVDRM